MKCYATHNIYGYPLTHGCYDASGHVTESTKQCDAGYNPIKCRHHIAQYDEFIAWANEVRAIAEERIKAGVK